MKYLAIPGLQCGTVVRNILLNVVVFVAWLLVGEGASYLGASWLASYGGGRSCRGVTEARGLPGTGTTRGCVALPRLSAVSPRSLWAFLAVGSPIGSLQILKNFLEIN